MTGVATARIKIGVNGSGRGRPLYTKLLQFGVFRFGLPEDGDIWVGVFPEGEEILVFGFRFCRVAEEGVGAGWRYPGALGWLQKIKTQRQRGARSTRRGLADFVRYFAVSAGKRVGLPGSFRPHSGPSVKLENLSSQAKRLRGCSCGFGVGNKKAFTEKRKP